MFLNYALWLATVLHSALRQCTLFYSCCGSSVHSTTLFCLFTKIHGCLLCSCCRRGVCHFFHCFGPQIQIGFCQAWSCSLLTVTALSQGEAKPVECGPFHLETRLAKSPLLVGLLAAEEGKYISVLFCNAHIREIQKHLMFLYHTKER